jgi:hypothetical protein
MAKQCPISSCAHVLKAHALRAQYVIRMCDDVPVSCM